MPLSDAQTARNAQRDKLLVQMYAEGYSLREVAEEEGLHFERVRQIVRRDAPHLMRAVGDTRQHSTGLASGRRR